MIKQKNLSQRIIFCIIFNLHSDQITQQICLAHLTDKILKRFDEGLLTGMILIDLQKAFDTINHKVLLQNLKAIRFSEQSIQWFRSYLCEQIFLVETENKLSDFGKISCGVPQGSILGPLLFLIYDMPEAIKSNLLLYPDDSCLMYQHKNTAKTEKILNEDFEISVTGLLITN